MSKRNAVAYVKPKDPTFLAKLKQDIGYKEQPTIEAKASTTCTIGQRERCPLLLPLQCFYTSLQYVHLFSTESRFPSHSHKPNMHYAALYPCFLNIAFVSKEFLLLKEHIVLKNDKLLPKNSSILLNRALFFIVSFYIC